MGSEGEYENLVQHQLDVYDSVASDIVPDIWELDPDINDLVSVDILLPNGFFMNLGLDRDTTLAEIKDEVWEAAENTPLFNRLRERDCYVFQCINLNTAQREELMEEDRRLCDVRPFQAILKLVEKKGDKEANILAVRLKYTIGHALQDFDEQNNVEVSDFRRQMKYFCDSVIAQLKQDSWEKRVLQLYPVALESTPELPLYLQNKLHDGNLVLYISVDRRITESTFKLSVRPDINTAELLSLVIKKKGITIGIQESDIKNYVLKICGLEEFLIGSNPLSQYHYIRDCLSCDKTPELVLVTIDTIKLESNDDCKCSEKTALERQRSRSINNEASMSLKRKKQLREKTWSIEQPLSLTVHSARGCLYDNNMKIAVQCGIFCGDEILCRPIHTSEKLVEEKEDKCVWNETVHFDIKVCNLPRAAKLCLCIYEFSPTQKNARFRKYGDGYASPLSWVNTMVFDYKGFLKSNHLTLNTWMYNSDEYSSMMLRPLGCLSSNPERDQHSITVSFVKYLQTAPLMYPTQSEILEYVDSVAANGNSSSTSGTQPHASKSHLEQLRQICEKDTLYQLHEQEKELMWFLRRDCSSQLPNSLPKLLRCGKWNDKDDIAEMTVLLMNWPPICPFKALELLDYAYPDPMVRTFAVNCLRSIGDEELSLCMLQLVQALKHEAYLENELAKFLLERALQNRHNAHRLFWLLRSEIHFPEVSDKFGLILEAYCRSVPSHLGALEKQVEAISRLRMANQLVQIDVNIKKEGREKLKAHIQDLLSKRVYQSLFRGLQNPLDPRIKFGKIRIEKCKFLDSKMKPLWLAFENTDTSGKDIFIIFKNGDDLRQDMLTLQMVRIMDRLWKEEGLDLRMIPYHCLATGDKVGLIEVVPDADTIANIQKEKGFTATSAFKKGSLYSWLKDHNPDENSLNKAAQEFTLSCAGYCVATYVLGVADRHSDNIMVKTNGQLFHVDFGHILGKFKEKFGFKRERVPFVLTHDFVYIITKGNKCNTQTSQEFTEFQQCCERAFMILRKKGPLVISLFAMMLSTGIPELSTEKDLDYLRETLVLDMSEQEALKHFRSKFDEALKNSWKTSMNWMAHNLAKDNKMSDG